ncbi:hypothetical protein OG985_22755 [Streptomyces sp. NBC_00289]|uniref:hypothetical protein n=1 Tax=Streptomyces sp. NBC_00289 TaxID=2975703 RepID=UPI0032546670
MTRPPARLLVCASALCLAGAPSLTACSPGGPDRTAPRASATTGRSAPAASPSPSPGTALTSAQAEAALITPADLGEPWTPTQGAATWRDTLLKATADNPDCGRLLEAVYTEDLFGPRNPIRAVAGLDDGMDEAQLRYQVIAHDPADVDRTLAWLRSLPQKCGRFTAATAGGAVQGGQVTEAALPPVGDAREGLRITLAGENADGEPTALTLDLAAVRVGDDAIVLTNGGLGTVSQEVTAAVVQLGTQRLTEVRRQARLEV